MFCSQCGIQTIEGAVFCQRCGARLPVDDAGRIPEETAVGEEASGTKQKEPAAGEEKTGIQQEKPAAGEGEAGAQPVESVAGEEAVHMQKQEPAAGGEAAKLIDVTLAYVGLNQGDTIKAVMGCAGLGLREAKELTDRAPVLLKKGVTRSEAEAVKTALHAAGADVTCTDQEGNNVDIVLRCKACGAPVEDAGALCSVCGRVSAPPSRQDGSADDGDFKRLFTLDTWKGAYEKFSKKPAAGKVISALGVLSAVVLAILVLAVLFRLIFSSVASVLLTVAAGYFLYYAWGGGLLTEYRYRKRSRDLHLPQELTSRTLLEALSGKFNYPFFKGVRFGEQGECIIDGRYSSYTVILYDNGTAALNADLRVEKDMKRTVMLEGMAVCSYLNKFFNPSAPDDVVKDVRALKSVEKQRKMIKVIFAAASVLVVAAFVLEFAFPGGLQRIVKPGAEVRGAYLEQYSKTVTVEEAFDDFFDNGKWSAYKEDGYSYVVFTGVCAFMGERADVRLTFKVTGERFRVDSLDVDGVEQGDFIMLALLSKIYEGYEEGV